MRRSRPAWSAWLASQGVVALEEVDTRALVRRLREDGAMRCALGTAPTDELHERALAQPHLDWERMLAEPGLESPPARARGVHARDLRRRCRPARRRARPRLQALDRAAARRVRGPGGGRARLVLGRRGAGARAGRRPDRERPGRSRAADGPGRDRARAARPGAALRHLPRPPARRRWRSACAPSSCRSATAARTIPCA